MISNFLSIVFISNNMISDLRVEKDLIESFQLIEGRKGGTVNQLGL